MANDWQGVVDWKPPPLKLVERPRRRRWPGRNASEVTEEGGELQGYVKGAAHNRQMQMYAMGARDALRWALGADFSPTASLSCTETALGWQRRKGRSRLKSVPVFVRKR